MDVREYYNEKSKNYDQKRAQSWLNPFIKKEKDSITRQVSTHPGETILDVGCGEGFYSKIFSEKGADVFGIDISEKMIEKYKKNGFKGTVMDISEERMGIDKKFDKVFCGGALEFIPRPDRALKNIVYYMNDGAYFTLLYPTKTFVGEMYKKYHALKNHIDIQLFTDVQIMNLLKKRGLAIVGWEKPTSFAGVIRSKKIKDEKIYDKSISFVLPMYNESKTIGQTIEKLTGIAESLIHTYEIIIIDDASNDNSVDIVRQHVIKNKKIKIDQMRTNTKFGGALARGLMSAQYETIIYIDSDLPVAKTDINYAVNISKDADIINGCSIVHKGENAKRKIMSYIYNGLVKLIFNLQIKDINSGFKIISRQVLDKINFISQSPFIDVELFLHAKKNKFKIIQYPLIFTNRIEDDSKIAKFSIIFATLKDMIRVKFFKKL